MESGTSAALHLLKTLFPWEVSEGRSSLIAFVSIGFAGRAGSLRRCRKQFPKFKKEAKSLF